MLTRIVKLTIATDQFFFTYSLWKNERFLEAYRHSKEFNEIWNETKTFFSGKPEAWSLYQIEDE